MTSGWRYVLTPRARRDMERVPVQMRRRIFAALGRLAADPAGADRRKMRGSDDEWRLRVGDWRVRYDIDRATRTIVVLHVAPRGRAYRD